MQLLFIRKLVYQVLILNTKQIGRMDTGKIYFAIPLVLFRSKKFKERDEMTNKNNENVKRLRKMVTEYLIAGYRPMRVGILKFHLTEFH